MACGAGLCVAGGLDRARDSVSTGLPGPPESVDSGAAPPLMRNAEPQEPGSQPRLCILHPRHSLFQVLGGSLVLVVTWAARALPGYVLFISQSFRNTPPGFSDS